MKKDKTGMITVSADALRRQISEIYRAWGMAEDDIEMGRLLGYSDAEIAAFLEVQEALILAP